LLSKHTLASIVHCVDQRKAILLDDACGLFPSNLRETMTLLAHSFGYNLKLFSSASLAHFRSYISPLLGAYLTQTGNSSAQLIALCLFDNCIEHFGLEAVKMFSNALIKGIKMELLINESDEDTKKAALYGLAQLACKAGHDLLLPHMHETLPHLLVILSFGKEELRNPALFENGISALASLVLIHNAPLKYDNFVTRDYALDLFLKNLPQRKDEDEACQSLSYD
jgi:hypothetical protein